MKRSLVITEHWDVTLGNQRFRGVKLLDESDRVVSYEIGDDEFQGM